MAAKITLLDPSSTKASGRWARRTLRYSAVTFNGDLPNSKIGIINHNIVWNLKTKSTAVVTEIHGEVSDVSE